MLNLYGGAEKINISTQKQAELIIPAIESTLDTFVLHR